MKENNKTICPFCDEGALETEICPSCGKKFLMCDDCESVFKNKDTLDEDCDSSHCPYCEHKL